MREQLSLHRHGRGTSNNPEQSPHPRAESAAKCRGILTVNLFRHLDTHLHHSELVQFRLEVPYELVEDIDAIWPCERVVEELEQFVRQLMP